MLKLSLSLPNLRISPVSALQRTTWKSTGVLVGVVGEAEPLLEFPTVDNYFLTPPKHIYPRHLHISKEENYEIARLLPFLYLKLPQRHCSSKPQLHSSLAISAPKNLTAPPVGDLSTLPPITLPYRSLPPNFQEITIRSISSYYEFLTNLTLDPEDVDFPPATGWPSMTPEFMAALNANERVKNLLRHIPYIDQPSGDKLCIMRETYPIQYNEPSIQALFGDEEHMWRYMPILYLPQLPPHAFCLANGKRDSYWIVIDTKRWVVVWGAAGGSNDGIWNGKCLAEFVPKGEIDGEGPDWWMDNPTFGIEEFFEGLKKRFRASQWMLDPGGRDVWEVYTGDEYKWDEEMKEIMQQCGWPGDGDGEGWNRDEAMDRMMVLDERMMDEP